MNAAAKNIRLVHFHTMVNKCVAHGYKTGYASQSTENIATFHFPNPKKYPELRAKWIRWVNRKDFTEASSSNVICEKHFEEKFISCGVKCRMKYAMHPMPTIYSAESLKRPSCLPLPDPPPRKLPKQRGILPDELQEFNKQDIIHDLSELGEEHAPQGFQTRKSNDCIVYYRMEFDQKQTFALFESI